jgi:hypothetical protein
MNVREVEPRKGLWAAAEICWIDQSGTACMARATLQDTSQSGACVRIRKPIKVGSRVTVKWCREQFDAVARNCRSDGWEFLLGVQREPGASPSSAVEASIPGAAKESKAEVRPAPSPGIPAANIKPETQRTAPVAAAVPSTVGPVTIPETKLAPAPPPPIAVGGAPGKMPTTQMEIAVSPRTAAQFTGQSRATTLAGSTSVAAQVAAKPAQSKGGAQNTNQERNAMEPKGLFPKLWGRQAVKESGGDHEATTMVKKAETRPAEEPNSSNGDLLSHEDIYRAAGLLQARSKCEINKVVDMLHCDRMQGVPEEIKRASVLMAIEAAGATADDILKDARERQLAIEEYETGQRKRLANFEARKAQENAQIEAEMSRVIAHYAERIKVNLDQVAAEKEGLHNWQISMKQELQRIAEVAEACNPAGAKAAAMGAAAGARSGATSASAPSLVSGLSARPN